MRSAIHHILVLVDGTASSFHASDYAIELARTLGAQLTGLAVVDTDTLRQLLNVRIRARVSRKRPASAGRSPGAGDEQTRQVRRRPAVRQQRSRRAD
jgi:nucleotide-binding universal stress UspA family protein